MPGKSAKPLDNTGREPTRPIRAWSMQRSAHYSGRKLQARGEGPDGIHGHFRSFESFDGVARRGCRRWESKGRSAYWYVPLDGARRSAVSARGRTGVTSGGAAGPSRRLHKPAAVEGRIQPWPTRDRVGPSRPEGGGPSYVVYASVIASQAAPALRQNRACAGTAAVNGNPSAAPTPLPDLPSPIPRPPGWPVGDRRAAPGRSGRWGDWMGSGLRRAEGPGPRAGAAGWGVTSGAVACAPAVDRTADRANREARLGPSRGTDFRGARPWRASPSPY
jgi:hypothetical protein